MCDGFYFLLFIHIYIFCTSSHEFVIRLEEIAFVCAWSSEFFPVAYDVTACRRGQCGTKQNAHDKSQGAGGLIRLRGI